MWKYTMLFIGKTYYCKDYTFSKLAYKYPVFSSKLKNINVYLFLRERETDRGEQGRGQERETRNPKQAPGSELSAQSPTWGSNSQTMRS